MPNPMLIIMIKIRVSVLLTQETSSAKTARLGSARHSKKISRIIFHCIHDITRGR